MSKIRRRKGLSWEPEEGWPLDRVLVGVATLRTARELYRNLHERETGRPRAWDLSLWSGVTAQGSADALERMRRSGLVEAVPSHQPGRAPTFRFVSGHPLFEPLDRLFEAERSMFRWGERVADRPGGAGRGDRAPRSRAHRGEAASGPGTARR